MNSRERVFTAMRCQTPDRVPYFDYLLLPPLASEILGRDFVDFGGDPEGWIAFAKEVGWEKAMRSYARDRIELSLKLGHDMIYSVPAPTMPKSTGNDEPITPSDDPVENMKRRVDTAESYDPSTDSYDGFLIFDYLIEEMEGKGVDLPIMGPACGHGVWTDIDLMMTMLIEPDLAHRHFQAVTRDMRYYVDSYRKSGVSLIMVGGDFAGNKPLISPEAYREFIMPEVRKVTDYIHQFGGYAINASDGDLWGVIDDFLTGCDVDGYNEIDQSVGMDMSVLHKRLGDRVCMFGNMDCGNVLSFGTEETIAKETVKCLESCNGKGHIFSASNAISASVPLNNYLTMLNTYRDFYGLPRFTLNN